MWYVINLDLHKEIKRFGNIIYEGKINFSLILNCSKRCMIILKIKNIFCFCKIYKSEMITTIVYEIGRTWQYTVMIFLEIYYLKVNSD